MEGWGKFTIGVPFYHGPTAPPQWAKAFSLSRIHDHRRATVGRTSLDECSARRRDLYLTTHNIHKKQTSIPPGGIRNQNLSKQELLFANESSWKERKIGLNQSFIYEGFPESIQPF
jgi:hypothetical protein